MVLVVLVAQEVRAALVDQAGTVAALVVPAAVVVAVSRTALLPNFVL